MASRVLIRPCRIFAADEGSLTQPCAAELPELRDVLELSFRDLLPVRAGRPEVAPLGVGEDQDGVGVWGTIDYEIGSCAVGNILSTEWKNRDTDPPIVGYEADLFSLGPRWTSRHSDPTEAKWLSEWYLNGPHRPRMYPRGSVTKLVDAWHRQAAITPGRQLRGPGRRTGDRVPDPALGGADRVAGLPGGDRDRRGRP